MTGSEWSNSRGIVSLPMRRPVTDEQLLQSRMCASKNTSNALTRQVDVRRIRVKKGGEGAGARERRGWGLWYRRRGLREGKKKKCSELCRAREELLGKLLPDEVEVLGCVYVVLPRHVLALGREGKGQQRNPRWMEKRSDEP